MSLEAFFQQLGIEDIGAFKPCGFYLEPMDELFILTEDCSYRADYKSDYIDLLWHPYEERLVGVKIKGFKTLVFNGMTPAQKKEIGDSLST